MNARFLPRPARNDNAAQPASSAARRHETELLLCGHHYRASREARTAADAAVRDLAA